MGRRQFSRPSLLGRVGGCPASRRLLPGSCQRPRVLLRRCSQKSGVALAQPPPPPCPLPGGGRAPGWGQRLCGSEGAAGCFAAETLSRPFPQGPRGPQGRERGQGRTEGFCRGAATANSLRRLNPLRRGAPPGLWPSFLLPQNQRSPLGFSANSPVLVLVILPPMLARPGVCVKETHAVSTHILSQG